MPCCCVRFRTRTRQRSSTSGGSREAGHPAQLALGAGILGARREDAVVRRDWRVCARRRREPDEQRCRPDPGVGAVGHGDALSDPRRAPALGRTFTADEDQPGRTREAILSYHLWQSHFGGDPRISASRSTSTAKATRSSASSDAISRSAEAGPLAPARAGPREAAQSRVALPRGHGAAEAGRHARDGGDRRRSVRRRPRARLSPELPGRRRMGHAARAAEGPDCRRSPPGAPRPARRGRVRAAHRVRQRRQPAARAGVGPREDWRCGRRSAPAADASFASC